MAKSRAKLRAIRGGKTTGAPASTTADAIARAKRNHPAGSGRIASDDIFALAEAVGVVRSA